ncbi:MAG: queuosine precursor transporter [Candidatus Adiutrix sp.]|jgi:uncharacterized integral membrane protein (TIGR00697 family)|nr:queuosine precursor transporter [Candidatus Adiutrix sp.]
MTDNPAAYKYLDLITGLFATFLIVSNFASTRIIDFAWGLSFDAGTLMFPLTYIFNDLLTEVYGYRRSRRVIWIGFLALTISAVSMVLVGLFPPAEGWEGDAAWHMVMGLTPRIVLASLAAYFIGEFINSYVLARMKVRLEGRFLAFRLIGSTAAGQVFDTLVFAAIAFIGVFSWDLWLTLVVSNYIFKVGVEALLLPATMAVVRRIKRAEGADVYDRETRFSPFRLA